MPELRAVSTSAPPGIAPRRLRAAWSVAPWRLLLLLVCLLLAASAAWLSWGAQRIQQAQAADPELMQRVAERWAEAAALAALPADDMPRVLAATLPAAQRADTARVLALIERQQQLEPEPLREIEPQRAVWATASQRLTSRMLESVATPDAARRLRDDAAAVAAASRGLMQALRLRAEARAAPETGAARPGVMLALASLALLALGMRRGRGDDAAADTAQARPALNIAPSAAELIDNDALQQSLVQAWAGTAHPDTPVPLLLVLQFDGPAALLAELGEGARLELERQIVRRLREHLRAGDCIALGEPQADHLELIVLAASMREPACLPAFLADIADAYTVFDHPVRALLRLGVVDPAAGHSQAGSALRDARLACASALAGTSADYTRELGESVESQQVLAGDVDEALRSGALSVAYRPLLALRDRACLGLRATLCWQHAALGPLDDAEVRRLAEQAGRAAQVQQFLEQQAFARAAALGGTRIGVAMPLSLMLADKLRERLAAAALAPAALELLIAEPAAADAESAAATLRSLRELGVAVTLRGLGQASASLSWLPRLAWSGVLIERRFVAQLPGHEAHRMLIQAIVSLAAQHGLATSADGVDNAAQSDALAALGVQAAQGDWADAALDAARDAAVSR